MSYKAAGIKSHFIAQLYVYISDQQIVTKWQRVNVKRSPIRSRPNYTQSREGYLFMSTRRQ